MSKGLRMNRCVEALAYMLVLGANPMAFGSLRAAAETPAARTPAPTVPAPPVATPAGIPAASADQDHVLYALGVLISRNLDDFQLTPEEFERVKSGLIDGFNHRANQVDLPVDSPKVQALRRERIALVLAKRVDEGKAYLDKAAALPGAKKTASGLVIVPIKPGTGAQPAKDATVLVRYEGKLVDGTVFDAVKDEPAKFELTGVIPCWSEALPLLKTGSKSRVVCPPGLAYGLRGSPPKIASQSTLDFTVELVAIAQSDASSEPASKAPKPLVR
jgi:FKBP-type peptidyl-prolyl cis-trans isomerase FkpA